MKVARFGTQVRLGHHPSWESVSSDSSADDPEAEDKVKRLNANTDGLLFSRFQQASTEKIQKHVRNPPQTPPKPATGVLLVSPTMVM